MISVSRIFLRPQPDWDIGTTSSTWMYNSRPKDARLMASIRFTKTLKVQSLDDPRQIREQSTILLELSRVRVRDEIRIGKRAHFFLSSSAIATALCVLARE